MKAIALFVVLCFATSGYAFEPRADLPPPIDSVAGIPVASVAPVGYRTVCSNGTCYYVRDTVDSFPLPMPGTTGATATTFRETVPVRHRVVWFPRFRSAVTSFVSRFR